MFMESQQNRCFCQGYRRCATYDIVGWIVLTGVLFLTRLDSDARADSSGRGCHDEHWQRCVVRHILSFAET